MFKFKINNDEWLVEEKNKDELREMYENETELYLGIWTI